MRGFNVRPRILAVDDDDGTHEAYRLIFEDQYELLSACDGPQALDILRSKPIDVMLLDIRMPGMDGFAVLEQARRLRPSLPVIIVSVMDKARSGWAAGHLGAVDYLTSPWNPDELEAAVRRALDGVANARPTVPVEATPRVVIISAQLGVRAGLTALLSMQCRVDGTASLSAAPNLVRAGPIDLGICDVPRPAEASQSATAHLRVLLPDVPRLIVGCSDVTGTDVEPGTQGITVVLPTFAVERVFEEAAALLATRPGLSAVRPPGRLVSRVLQHIIMNFPNLEIEEIAQAVRVSPRHLYRVFTAELEMVTPKDFLDRVRIEAAKCLLKESSAKLDAIAQMVGFCDAPHLSRVFRRHTGQTPRMYRLN